MHPAGSPAADGPAAGASRPPRRAQATFHFFGDAKRKALRPLALSLKRVPLEGGESLPTQAGMIYLVEKGTLAPGSAPADGRCAGVVCSSSAHTAASSRE